MQVLIQLLQLLFARQRTRTIQRITRYEYPIPLGSPSVETGRRDRLKLLQANHADLTLVCDHSSYRDLTNLGFPHKPSVQQALDEATSRLGPDSKVLVMPYGAVTHAMPS